MECIKAAEKHPKLFTGFSDTAVNHLMFNKLGLSACYGPNFICDLGENADEMLPYTKSAFEGYLEGNESGEIVSGDIWYEEREAALLKEKGVFDAVNGVLVGKPQDEAY